MGGRGSKSKWDDKSSLWENRCSTLPLSPDAAYYKYCQNERGQFGRVGRRRVAGGSPGRDVYNYGDPSCACVTRHLSLPSTWCAFSFPRISPGAKISDRLSASMTQSAALCCDVVIALRRRQRRRHSAITTAINSHLKRSCDVKNLFSLRGHHRDPDGASSRSISGGTNFAKLYNLPLVFAAMSTSVCLNGWRVRGGRALSLEHGSERRPAATEITVPSPQPDTESSWISRKHAPKTTMLNKKSDHLEQFQIWILQAFHFFPSVAPRLFPLDLSLFIEKNLNAGIRGSPQLN